MFYYIKTRKKGTINWKAVRAKGKIVVFSKYEDAKEYLGNFQEMVNKIVTIPCHPANKQSQIYGKRYEKMGW